MSLNWKKASFGYSPQYNSSASSTFINIGANFSLNYDGNVLDSANGTTFYDWLSIGGAVVKKQQFAQITSIAYYYFIYSYSVSKL